MKHTPWAYKGKTGPQNWKNLCTTFADCGGQKQSPVNIVSNDAVKDNTLAAIEFSYSTSNIHIVSNNHSIQFNISGKNKIRLNRKDYTLLQFHYHARSEHSIDGKFYPIEAHFVHRHAEDDWAVVGIMFEEGESHMLFEKYLGLFPKTGAFCSEETIDLHSLLPDNKSYFHYDGSLTTPPCSEVVHWYILQTPLTASKEQIEQFSKILHHNYRPVLPLNGRKIGVYNE